MNVTNVHAGSGLALARELQAAMQGRVVLRGDDDDACTRQIWNGAVEHQPAIFVVRETSADVQAAVQEEPTVFDARFSRCFRLLHFVACRVLCGPERAHDAIEACWLTASRNPPRFEYEGEFRRWLVRVLIDEALAILRNETKSGVKNIPQSVPAEENQKLADYCLE